MNQQTNDIGTVEIVRAASKSELIEPLEAERQRGDALAATIIRLQNMITHDMESKEEFIDRVRQALGTDPDERLTDMLKDAKRDGLLMAHTIAVMQIGCKTNSPISDICAEIEETILSL